MIPLNIESDYVACTLRQGSKVTVLGFWKVVLLAFDLSTVKLSTPFKSVNFFVGGGFSF